VLVIRVVQTMIVSQLFFACRQQAGCIPFLDSVTLAFSTISAVSCDIEGYIETRCLFI
jgi:hypothetical protein